MTWPSQPTFLDFDVCKMARCGETGGWHLSLSYLLNSELQALMIFFTPASEMFSHYTAQMLLAGSDMFDLIGAKVWRVLVRMLWHFNPWWGYESSQIHFKGRYWWHIRSNKNLGGITPTVGMGQRSQGLISSSWEKYSVIFAFSNAAQLRFLFNKASATRSSNNQNYKFDYAP